MSYVTIRSLLERHLNANSVGSTTAFENAPFSPVNGEPYQRVTLLPAQTDNPTMGDGFKRESGIFQVMLSYPINAGPAPATTRANELCEAFKRGTTLESGSLRVQIDKSPFISQGFPDGTWYRLPVSIPFTADVYS